VEPGEVEAVLLSHHTIASAHVSLSEDKRLVAYLVPRLGLTVPTSVELRDWLRRVLPEHMIPSAYVRLDRLPLTFDGKTHTAALPQPAATSAEGAHHPPVTETERVVASIWCEVLNVPEVSVQENFFDLGGHSLLMYQVHDRLSALPGGTPTLIELFEYPTVRSLAARLEEGADAERQDARAEGAAMRQDRSRLGLRRARRAESEK
jgi:hypothetical protein